VADPTGSAERRHARAESRRGWSIVARPVLQFALLGLAAAIIVGIATAIASRRVGEREAVLDARTTALVKAQGVVQPALTDGLLTGDEAAIHALDEVVQRYVLDTELVRVKIWSEDGTILYSDVSDLISDRFTLDEEERDAIDQQVVEADVSDLDRPENRFERRYGKLLEVYLPLRTPNGTPVLFEAYLRYDAVTDSATRVWKAIAPIAIGSLIVLELIQIPLAWSLAQRLRRRQLASEGLLRRALDASELERRRIAQDLHDGVVQDLAGVSYSLAAQARSGGEPRPEDLESSAETVRRGVEALRTLMVEIYPPDLADEGLAPAVADLLARARAAGLETSLDASDLDAEPPASSTRLLYRVAQEALRNVIGHAEASSVSVRLGSSDRLAWIEVADDGRGFDPGPVTAHPVDGHLGLVSLTGLVTDAGGTVAVRSAPGEGATVRAEVPQA
jgi:two-component system, NarL family, sensor kinase